MTKNEMNRPVHDDENLVKMNDILMAAVKAGDLNELTNSLSKGADPNARNNFRDTALMRAMLKNQRECYYELLEAGAGVDSRNEEGWTPLMFAVTKLWGIGGRLDFISDLLSRGANKNARLDDGWTAMGLAVMDDKEDCTRTLVEHGADLECETDDGRTALMIAVENTASSCVRILLEHGAMTDKMFKNGKTVLDRALEIGNEEIIQLIVPYMERSVLSKDSKSGAERLRRKI